MAIVKVIELIGSSSKSWEEAAQNAVQVASETIRGILGVDVINFTAKVKDGKITDYKTNVKIAFQYEG